MNRKRLSSLSLALIVFSLLISSPLFSTSPATAADISDQLAKAVDFYIDLEFDKGLAITDELLSRNNLSANDSIAIFEIKSIITYAKGQKYKREAFGYLKSISDIGPCLIHLPREIWPTELRDYWYELCLGLGMLVCQEEADPEIQTIAVMEFDNFSVGKYKEELGDLSKGIADFFEYDFSRFSNLKVVERDKIDFILKELELAESGKIDPATAARIGKMLGAQLMVFGSITQLDKGNGRMIARVVKVETSEIILSADKEGKPNFITMEKELVKDLAEQLNLLLSKETDMAIMDSGTEDMDAAKLYSLGLKYMDKYEYEKAYDFFKQAFEKDSNFIEAKRKMEIYKPLIG